MAWRWSRAGCEIGRESQLLLAGADFNHDCIRQSQIGKRACNNFNGATSERVCVNSDDIHTATHAIGKRHDEQTLVKRCGPRDALDAAHAVNRSRTQWFLIVDKRLRWIKDPEVNVSDFSDERKRAAHETDEDRRLLRD